MELQEVIDYIEKNYEYIKQLYDKKDNLAKSMGNMYEMARKHCTHVEGALLISMVEEFQKKRRQNGTRH